MNTLHVNCPRCGGVFQVAQAIAGQRVACPWCHDAVTALVPGQPPPAVPQNQNTSAGEDLAAVPPVDSLLPPMAADPVESAPPDDRANLANAAGEDAVRQATRADGKGMSQRVLQRMSRQAKDNRRRRKGLIMMAVGALVLVVAAAILLQL